MKLLKEETQKELPLDLTQDIVADILARLNVKTLSRLKCVSRTWLNFISDPLFVNTHRQQSMKNVKFISWSSRKLDNDNSGILSFYFLGSPTHSYRGLPSFIDRSIIHICPVSCDLVCFRNEEKIYLGNPSINEFCVLPKPSTTLFNTKLGFGYSDEVRKYKVVRLFPNFTPRKRLKTEGDTKSKGMECEILTFSDDSKISASSWKPLSCPRMVYPRTVSAGGRIYWLINHRSSLYTLKTEELILSFEIANDTFSTLPRPSSWPLENFKDSLVFMVLDGMLCITNKRSMQKNAILDIWMLKENCFWTKLYSINLLDYSYGDAKLSRWNIRHMHPECMNGTEIVFAIRSSHHWIMGAVGSFLCNTESKTLRQIAHFHGEIGIFWESLFRLK